MISVAFTDHQRSAIAISGALCLSLRVSKIVIVLDFDSFLLELYLKCNVSCPGPFGRVPLDFGGEDSKGGNGLRDDSGC